MKNVTGLLAVSLMSVSLSSPILGIASETSAEASSTVNANYVEASSTRILKPN